MSLKLMNSENERNKAGLFNLTEILLFGKIRSSKSLKSVGDIHLLNGCWIHTQHLYCWEHDVDSIRNKVIKIYLMYWVT